MVSEIGGKLRGSILEVKGRKCFKEERLINWIKRY